MKKNNWRDWSQGYAIIRDGHTMFAEDVCQLLNRLDFLEKERLKLSNNTGSPKCQVEGCGNVPEVRLCKECLNVFNREFNLSLRASA